MKRIYLFLLLITSIIFIGCKTSESTSVFGSGQVNVSSVNKLSIDTLNFVQVDSMILADKLPKLNKWNSSTMKDYESGKQYIYSTLYDSHSNIIYTVKTLSVNEIYVVMKKRIKSSK